jgi:hypothetical protein
METGEKQVVVIYMNEDGILSAGLVGQEQIPLKEWPHTLEKEGITINSVKLLELLIKKNPGSICVHNPYTCQTCCFPPRK